METQTTKLLSRITEQLTASVAELSTVKMPNLPSNKNKNKKNKRKPWWDSVLTKLHADVCQTYILYREANFAESLKEPFSKAKKTFRQYRRYCEKLHHKSKLNMLHVNYGLN